MNKTCTLASWPLYKNMKQAQLAINCYMRSGPCAATFHNIMTFAIGNISEHISTIRYA